MSFISNALGVQNGFTVQNPGGSGAPAYQTTDQQNEQAIYGQQGTLAQQLLAQANGQGPNIANLQLQQATNQNIQQGAGQVASQRGMNPALAQRIIAQNTAAANQNAAGQSGVLRAQQQLAAQNGLANVYGQQAGEAATNLQTYIGGAQAANQSNAQIAQNNANQGANAASGVLSPLSSILYKGGEVKHLEEVSVPIGDKIHPLHLAQGGPVHMASGGMFPTTANVSIFSPLAMGQGGSGGVPNVNPNMFKTGSTSDPMAGATSMQGADATEFGGSSIGDAGVSGLSGAGAAAAADEGAGGLALLAAHGGKIPVVLSPGELKIPAYLVDAVAKGKIGASKAGEKVPGKAKVKGDSPKNDTFITHANAGDVIVKRTKAQNDEDARQFLLAIKADKEKKNGPSGYAKILATRRKNA